MFKPWWSVFEEAKDGESGGSGSGAPPADAPPASDDGGQQQDKGGDPKADWSPDWRVKMAGGDAKEAKRLERYASPIQAWNSYRALENRVSSGELRSVLPKDATAEQKTAWRKENGIPDAPDKYDLTLKDGLVVGEADKPAIDAFLKAAHSADMPSQMVKAAVEWYFDFQDQQAAAVAAKDIEVKKTSEDQLRSEWGQEYRPNINALHSFLDLAPGGVKDQLLGGRLADGTPFMSDPKVLNYLLGLARELNPLGTVVPQGGTNMAASVDTEIAELEKFMKTNRSEYNRDEKKQARLRELYGARDMIKQKAA